MGAGGGIWEALDVITAARANQKTILVAAAESAIMYSGQLWMDTDDDVFYQRNNANDSWLTVMKIGQTIGGNLVPDGASTRDLGSAAAEWANLYLGTGKAYFFSDQAEYIYSDDSALIFGTGGADVYYMGPLSLGPSTADGPSLGGASNEWANLYIGTGKIYFGLAQDVELFRSGLNVLSLGAGDCFGATTFVGDVLVDYNNPSITMTDTAVPPVGMFQIFVNADLLQLRGRNAGDTGYETILYLERIADGGDVYPGSANAQDLGRADAEWANLYVGTGKIYLGTGQDVTLERSVANELTLGTGDYLHLVGPGGASDDLVIKFSKFGGWGTTYIHEYYTSSTDWGMKIKSGDAGTLEMIKINNDIGSNNFGSRVRFSDKNGVADADDFSFDPAAGSGMEGFVYDYANGRVYFYGNGGVHYCSQDAGFPFGPGHERCALTGEKFELGDIVIMKIDRFATDGVPHGIPIKFDVIIEDKIKKILGKMDINPTGT